MASVAEGRSSDPEAGKLARIREALARLDVPQVPPGQSRDHTLEH